MSDIITLSVTSCDPGMVLASDIFNEFGAVILYKNSILDEYAINKLSRLRIDIVKVYKQYEFREKKSAIIEAQYNNNVAEFKGIIWDISCGKNVDFQKVQDVTRNLTHNFDSINDVVNCLNKVRSIDEYTYAHSLNVSLLASLLGKWLNLSEVQVNLLTYCGLLHDIGKSKVSPEILNKPDVLTKKEFEEIKMHPVNGYKMLEKNIAISKDICNGVLMHHEREDGSGYPFGLKSEKIHFFGKVIAVVDIYDAMTSNRSYKKRQPPFDVLEMFESEYLTKCDTGIMLTFLKHISSYYVGNTVRLSDGSKGEIIYINSNRVARPIVRLDDDSIIDLSKNKELKIVEML